MERYDLTEHPLTIVNEAGGTLSVYVGERSFNSYLDDVADKGAYGETLVFNPPDSTMTVTSETESYLLDGAGTVVVAKDASPRFLYSVPETGSMGPLAKTTTAPEWWESYEGEPMNTTGYRGDEWVGVYDLSERRNTDTGGSTEWTNDAVSARPEEADGVFGFSYMTSGRVNDGGPNDMVPIYENRPVESIHRHPKVHQYVQGSDITGIHELYVVVEGKVGIGVFHPEEGTMDYHLLEAGEALVVDPDETHAILATSKEFAYACAQTPSTYHYPFEYTKHDFSPVSEMEQRLGYDVNERLKGFTEPGVYTLDVDARALGID